MKVPGVKQQVMLLIAQFLKWVSEVLESGKLPNRGFYNEAFPKGSKRAKNAGKDIMGNYKATFFASKSDGKARIAMHRFARWWKCRLMCDGCKAENPACKRTDPRFHYSNFGAGAGWVETVQSHEDYMRDETIVSPFMMVPGIRKETILRDWAHLDPLGFGRDLGGGLLKSFYIRGELGHGPLDELSRGVWGELQTDRKAANKKRVAGSLTPSSTGLDNMYVFPELGSLMKAKRVDILNNFLCRKAVAFADRCPNDDDDVGKTRGTVALGFLEMHKVLNGAGMFLTDDEVVAFKFFGTLFLLSLQKLCNLDVLVNRHVWRVRPKHHQLDHLLLDIATFRLNPKRITCLLEEDFLGQLKRITKYCRGVGPVSMMGRIFDRYMLNLSLRWHKRKRAL